MTDPVSAKTGDHQVGIHMSELIRIVFVSIVFLVTLPFVGIAGACFHDARYDELLDDW